MSVIYYEDDADPTALAGKAIGIIGYGTLGRAFAANLRDGAVPIVVSGSGSEQIQAEADGFLVKPMGEATRLADILLLALPDEILAQTYIESISSNLRRGHSLIFKSAYTIAFGFVEPPPFVDVGLVAPRVSGTAVRRNFLAGEGFLSFVAVGQDASRHAWETVLAVALVIGSLKTGAIEVNIEQEAALSLFIQQAILPAFYHIMTTSAHLLMGQGYPSEAVLTDLYLSGRFNDYVQRVTRSGLLHALRQASKTEQYGVFSRLSRFNELKLERLMEVTLEEIRGGKFGQEWSREFADGHPRLDRLRREQEAFDLWELEQQTLEFFPPEEPTPPDD